MAKVPQWTPAQKAAVQAVGRDIRVSASAGTGKTAVLTHRVLARICDPKKPAQIDELLVLTYTDAAAEEMRSRIDQALRTAFRTQPSDHLRRQILLLDAAWISTFHAFCKRVITEHFYRLDLDPNFGIVDPDQKRLLQADALVRTLEAAWADPQLATGMRQVFSKRDIRLFERGSFTETILSLSEFLESIPEPKRFFSTAEQLYRLHSRALAALMDRQREHIAHILDTCARQVHQSKCTAAKIAGPGWLDKVTPDYLNTIEQAQTLLAQKDLSAFREFISDLQLPRMPNKPKEIEKELAEQIKYPISKAKDALNKLSDFALGNPDYERIVFPRAGLQTCVMAELVSRFNKEYTRAKQQIRCLDFADLEHTMLRLLAEFPETAEALRSRYRHIFVDEFQDINPVQKRILDAIRRRDNVFLVGDIKQSIYAFRQSRPQIFLEELKQASEQPADPAQPQRIDLAENFRSRRPVLEFTNAVFGRIMTEQTASMDYDRRAALVPGRTDADSESPLKVELCLLDEDLPEADESNSSDDNDNAQEAGPAEIISALQRQAAYIAHRIQRMVGAETGNAEFQILDRQTGQLRDVQYRDIVVLMRSVAHRANEYTEIFRVAGVPVSSQTSAGYFETTEVTDCLCLLKVLDNPLRDIELAAAFRSAMFGFSDSRLAAIRLHSDQNGHKDALFYHAVTEYAQSGPDDNLRQQTACALQQLAAWRTEMQRGSLSDTLGRILDTTGYLSFVSALPNGCQRTANLLKLHDRAIQFEHFNTSPKGTSLSRFIEFLEKLADQAQDWAPAQPDSASENAVRICSVHRSKGLEFPVVFLAELNSQFNTRDLTAPCLADEEHLGLQIVIPEKQAQFPTLAHQVIARQKRQTLLEEEMRILYVALTRARDKLILTASRKEADCKKILDDCVLSNGEPPADWKLLDVRRPVDWILYGLGDQPALQALYGNEIQSRPQDFFTAQRIDRARLDRITKSIESARQHRLKQSLPKYDATTKANAQKLYTDLSQRLSWTYPHRGAVDVPAKLSISEWTHRSDEFQPADTAAGFTRVPEVLIDRPETTPGPAQIGTAVHHVLATLELSKKPDAAIIEQTLKTLIEQDKITPRTAQAVNPQQLLRFFDSPLGQLTLQHADNVLREWPFTLAVPARELGLADTTEPVILQGIVDLIIPANDGLIIVDYKTDRISADQIAERSARYQPQITAYARAAAQILHQPVRQAVLYYLSCAQSGPIHLHEKG